MPPQQESWWDGTETKVESGPGAPEGTSAGGEAADGRMSLEEAKELRLELMAERTKKQGSMERSFETYNFCEH